MSASDRIIAGSLHCTDPPLLQLLKTGGSDDSKVMVNAAAAEFRLNAVDSQAMPGIQLQSADAKPVYLFIFLIAPLHRCHAGVQVRGIHIPKLRILNLDSCTDGFSFPRQHGNRVFCLGDHIALVVHNFMPHFDIRYCLGDAANIGFDANHGKILFCLQGCQTHAIRGNMDLPALIQINIPVDSGAGIPPGAGDAVSHDHLQIVFSRANKGGNVQQKWCVPIDVLTCKAIVYENGAIHIHAFKFQIDAVCFLKLKGLRIMHRFIGKISHTVAIGQILLPLIQDHGIVRKGYRNFLLLLGCHTFQGCSCPFVHFPVIVKLLSFHGAPPFQISMNISFFTDIII